MDDAEEESPAAGFHLGEHVFQFVNYTRHGIVTDTHFDATARRWSISVTEFRDYVLKTPRGIRTIRSDPHKWLRVRYELSDRPFAVARSDPFTAARSDPPEVVLARIKFLQTRPLPAYDKAAGECFAVWCRTGTWTTLKEVAAVQGNTFWAESLAAPSLVTATAVASAPWVTVPAGGLWGFLGYTTQASLISLQPWLLLPIVAAGGALALGHAKKEYREKATEFLNVDFWEAMDSRPDLIIAYIRYFNPDL